MLSSNETAVAYAHLKEAIEDWNGLLNVVYDCILEEDKPFLDSMDKHLTETMKILEP